MVVVEWTGEVTVQMCGAVDTILRAQNSTTHTPVLLHCKYDTQSTVPVAI
jgi:hypothetical protein